MSKWLQISRLGERFRRLVNQERALFLPGEIAEELTIEHHGPVEIRQTLAGWSLETSVEGEPDRARSVALARLGSYANGGHRGSAQSRLARPLVQAEEGARRWRIRAALPDGDAKVLASAPRKGSVRLHARNSETLAIIRVPGRPTPLAIRHAETAIRHAIAATRWQPTSGAMLRLHAPIPVLPFLGRFEVAVPVVERTASATAAWTRQTIFDARAAQEAATQSAPPVR